jgi:very-short-patch-repair endonuclease
MKKKCKQCGKEIKNYKVFCSVECYYEYSKDPTHNSFYGKTHSQETKNKLSQLAKERCSNGPPPFYGRHHTEENKQQKSKYYKESGMFLGEKNPFYGRHHDENTKEIIKEKNKIYRENNKEIILQRYLKRLSLTKEKIEMIFYEYRDGNINLIALGNKYDVDNRVLKRYFILFNICSEEELKKLTRQKKIAKSISYPESVLYKLLCDKYGEENVQTQYELGPYYYDFLLFELILIEYDGFHWHKEMENNDIEKNKLAKEKGIRLYRIEEPNRGGVNFEEHLVGIDGYLYGI